MSDPTYYFSGNYIGRNFDFTDKEGLISYHTKLTFAKTQSMFEYDFGSDKDTISTRDIELLIQTKGFGIGIEYQGKHYVLDGSLGGEYNPYYMPTKAIISNPALNISKDYVIDKDCVIFNNDGVYLGTYPIIKYYAEQMADNDLSRRLVLINTRAAVALAVDNDDAKRDAESFLNKLGKGEQGVIMDKSFSESIKSLPLSAQGSAQTIIQLLEDKQYIKGSLWNELGIQSNYNMKRETITANENILNVDSLLPLCDDMMKCRKIAIEKYNKMFGTNWSVKFSSAWEKLRTEIKLSQERDFGGNKDKSNQLDKNKQYNKDNKENTDET